MTTCPSFDYLMILPRLRVQNANAISSQLTHGFPSITAFLGLMWALQRQTNCAGFDLVFKAVGVVCHDYEEQVTDDNYPKTFRLRRHPIDNNRPQNKIGKKGELVLKASIIEEGHIHLDMSLVFAVTSQRWNKEPSVRNTEITTVAEILSQLRIASGTLLPTKNPANPRYHPKVIELTGTPEDQEAVFIRARRHLLPGFALVSRPDLLETRLVELQVETPTATQFDAWLSFSRRQWRYQADEQGKKGRWQSESRKEQGWIVPIPVGYIALDGLHAAGSVANARDNRVPFSFVESLYSLGQWISPHRVHTAADLLWYAEEDTYLCRNNYWRHSDAAESFFDDDY